MAILQAGELKSGNLYLFSILQNIRKHSGESNRSFIQHQPIFRIAREWNLSHRDQAKIDMLEIGDLKCFYHIGNIFHMPIEDIDAYLKQTNHVWSHSPISKTTRNIFAKFDKVIYIVRDPRDRAISMANYAFSPYWRKHHAMGEESPSTYLENRLERMMRSWVNHVANYFIHAETLNIYVIFYERLLASLETELSGLLDYLEISLTNHMINKIRREVDFNKMNKLNPHHVRKGKANEWTKILNTEQIRKTNRICAPMLRLLNYPISLTKADDILPRNPAGKRPIDFAKAITHAKYATIVDSSRRKLLSFGFENPLKNRFRK